VQSRGGSATRRQARIRGSLVVAEVAVSVVLLLGTGVLVRNFVSLINVDLGFDTSHTMLMRVAFAPGSYETAESRLRVYRELLDRVGRLPGVTSMALSNGMSAFGGFEAAIAANGRPADDRPRAFVKGVSEGYRTNIGLRLLAGRDLTRADLESSTPVAMINQSFARRYFGNDNPLGRAITITTPADDEPAFSTSQFVVVGILQDVINDDIRQPVMPEADVPLTFYLPPRIGLTVRTSGDPLSIGSAVRREARAIDENIALTPTVALETAVYESFYSQPGFVRSHRAAARCRRHLRRAGLYRLAADERYRDPARCRGRAGRHPSAGPGPRPAPGCHRRGTRAGVQSWHQPPAREPAVADVASRSRGTSRDGRPHRRCRPGRLPGARVARHAHRADVGAAAGMRGLSPTAIQSGTVPENHRTKTRLRP
jgi:hypothetical protein